MDENWRAWMAAGFVASDLSADGLPVELGRLDEEQPTFRVFSRNPREHIVVEMVGNGLVERSRICHSSVGERGGGGRTFLIDAATINCTFVQSEMGPGLIRES
jgi:hypothetical protein